MSSNLFFAANPAVAKTTQVQSVQAVKTTNAAPQSKTSMLGGMLPMIVVFIVLIFFMNRSQKKQQRKREEMIEHSVRGTEVILQSGTYGVIDEVKEDCFIVKIAENVKIKVAKQGIANVIQPETPAAK